MFKTSILSSLVLLSLMFSACSKEKNSQQASSIDDANAVLSTNEFILTALDKTEYVIDKKPNGFALKNTQGKVIILDIFATWCPPCRAEASHLTSLQKKYKDELVVFGITIEDGIENSKLEAFRKEYNANYILVNSNENSRLIEAVANKLDVGKNFGIPLMALYKDGELIRYYQGAVEEEFLESDIKKALGK